MSFSTSAAACPACGHQAGTSTPATSAPPRLAGRAIGLAKRTPVTSAWDVMITRGDGGRAKVRHRQGAVPIGDVLRTPEGAWTAELDGGRQLSPHTHQRAALAELIGTWNASATRPERWAQPVAAAQPPAQTPLMQQFGIPAVRTLATPASGSGDGPRSTGSSSSDSDDDSDSDSSGPAGLNPKGIAIYKRLIAKGFPAARALAFARNSQNSSFGRKAA